jgi:predicted MFS family arabinose efflux permease
MRNLGFIIFLLAACQFVHVMDFMVMMPLNPFLRESMQIDIKAFNYLISAYAFSAGAFALITAPFIEKFDRKYALLLLLSGFILGTFGCAFAKDYSQLIIARIVSGAFGGMTGTMVISMVGDLVPIHKRAFAMSMIMVAFSLSSIVGMPVGIYLADNFTWSAPFLAIAILSIIVLLACFIFLPNVNDHLNGPTNKQNIFDVFKRSLFDANQRNALILMFLVIIGQFTVIPTISAYMVTNVGLEKTDLTYIYMIGGIATTITMPLIGKWADRSSRSNIFTLMILLSLVPIFILTRLGEGSVQEALLVTVPFFIFISGRMVPAHTIIASAVAQNQRAGFMSINTAVREFAAAISTQIAAFVIIDSGSSIENYEIIGYIAIFSSLIALFFVRKIKIIS